MHHIYFLHLADCYASVESFTICSLLHDVVLVIGRLGPPFSQPSVVRDY